VIYSGAQVAEVCPDFYEAGGEALRRTDAQPGRVRLRLPLQRLGTIADHPQCVGRRLVAGLGFKQKRDGADHQCRRLWHALAIIEIRTTPYLLPVRHTIPVAIRIAGIRPEEGFVSTGEAISIQIAAGVIRVLPVEGRV